MFAAQPPDTVLPDIAVEMQALDTAAKMQPLDIAAEMQPLDIAVVMHPFDTAAEMQMLDIAAGFSRSVRKTLIRHQFVSCNAYNT